MADELPVEADAGSPEDAGGLPVDEMVDETEVPAVPLSDKQKMIFFTFVLMGTIALAALTSNFSKNVAKLNETPTPEVTPAPMSSSPYSDENIGIKFMIPPGWVVEVPGSISLDFIGLKPSGSGLNCFPRLDTCPIMIEVRENSKGAPPSQFGTPFYPATSDIQGGQDSTGVGGYTATVLYNIKGNGGRIIYIQREWEIIKISLQEGLSGRVTLADSDIFDKFISSIKFTY